MFEEFIVGDLHALNLVDYLTTTDFVHGGGGWWYGDLSIPAEYRNSEKFYMWYHLYIESLTAMGIRIGLVPAATYCRSIRVEHNYTTTGATWIGGETYEPFYAIYDGSSNSSYMFGGQVTLVKQGTTWGRGHFMSECHKYNGNGYTAQSTNSGDLSSVDWNNTTAIRISSGGLPTTGTPIAGKVELYALSPRSLL